jgi:hypothetical protein
MGIAKATRLSPLFVVQFEMTVQDLGKRGPYIEQALVGVQGHKQGFGGRLLARQNAGRMGKTRR